MKSRAQIQKAHEAAVLLDSLKEHNRLHALELNVVSRPDPPDAVLSDGSMTTWMELTDAFFSQEWAKDLSSHGSIKGHTPMASGLYVGMDTQFAEIFCDLVEQKASKTSYRAIVELYGPGILVVGLESPWLDGETLDEIATEWASRGSPDISATFAYVYTRHRAVGGNLVLPWPRPG